MVVAQQQTKIQYLAVAVRVVGYWVRVARKEMRKSTVIRMLVVLPCLAAVGSAFTFTALSPGKSSVLRSLISDSRLSLALFGKLSDKRRRDLGVSDDEDEYDLSKALETNTDPLITKIIAGSLIVVIIVLLAVGVIIPSTTDYGEGVCNPLLTGGRC